MSIDRTANSWIEIGPRYLDAAVEVLALAFQNDPLMMYACSGPAYASYVREVFRFVCEARWELGWPIIGTTGDSGLNGVACLSAPGEKVWPPSLVKKYDRLQASVSNEAFNRMGRFSRLSRKYSPAPPHYYLAAIGVHPAFQERGLGGVLLGAVHGMSESDPESTGVYLETARPENVRLYEHFGYRVFARDKLDDAVEFWYMFRPNGVSSPRPAVA
jgi:ribosomal protein S18 acetylase RimI-like enzyme